MRNGDEPQEGKAIKRYSSLPYRVSYLDSRHKQIEYN